MPAVLLWASLAIIIGIQAFRFQLLETRTFDPDELQHLHAAVAVHAGLLPYRDFFEHHMPALPYLLAPALSRFAITGNADDVTSVAIAARRLMWLCVAGALALTVAIGARLGGSAVGWIAAALLSLSLVFTGRTMEIRPDVPALVCWLTALWALLRASPLPGGRVARGWLAIAGVALGCALAFNQKLLMAGPGFAVLLIAHIVSGPATLRRVRVADALCFAATVASPLIVVGAWFWVHGALQTLLAATLFNNLGWVREVTAGSTLRWLMLRDPWVSALAAAGLVQALIDLVRSDRPSHRGLAVALWPTASLLVGLAIIPAPYPQYLLPILPVGAVCAARFIWRLLRGDDNPGRGGAIALAVSGAVGILVAVEGAIIARPLFLHVALYPAVAGTAVFAALWLKRGGRAGAAAAVVLVACSTFTAQQLRWMQGLSNAEQVRQMRLIHASTGEGDRVLDGFSGLAWFRPSAAAYPFFHAGVRGRLTAADVAGLVALVGNCASRPKVVVLDQHLDAVSPELRPVISRGYRQIPSTDIWVRDDQRLCTRDGG